MSLKIKQFRSSGGTSSWTPTATRLM